MRARAWDVAPLPTPEDEIACERTNLINMALVTAIDVIIKRVLVVSRASLRIASRRT